MRVVGRGDSSNALAFHSASTVHTVQWEESEVIQELRERRRIKEANLIKEMSKSLNAVGGLILNPSWTSLQQVI